MYSIEGDVQLYKKESKVCPLANRPGKAFFRGIMNLPSRSDDEGMN